MGAMASSMKKLLGAIFWPEEDRLRLPEMLEIRGAQLPERLSEADGREAARAARRCLYCNSKNLCDAYLKAGNPDAYRGFCPNGAYVASLRDKARTLT
jgi:hypothetical protein